MENKGMCFLDSLQLCITWVVLCKNNFVTLKSGGKPKVPQS